MSDDSQTTTETTVEAPETSVDTDWKAEAEKWKSHSRKWEGTAKQNADAAKRLADIEEAQKTAEQKAADRAADLERRASEAEMKALRYEVGTEKGLPAKLMRYLTGSTKEDLEASAEELLEVLGARTAPEPKPEEKPEPVRPKEAMKPGNTNVGEQGPGQLTRDDLKTMTPEQIVKAKEEGRLNTLLGIT